MKLSDALVQVWSLATDAPQFSELRKSAEGKETIRLFKLLYKEVMAVEAEGQEFDDSSDG